MSGNNPMFDGAKKNQAAALGNLSSSQTLSADERNKASGSIIQPISADQRPAVTVSTAAAGPVGLPSTLNTGLAAYWKLSEASGTRADSLGISNLTDNNTVASAAGIINNAASFIAANSESLTVANNASLQTGDIDWTISIWVYIHSKATLREVISKVRDGTTKEYELYFYDGTNQWILQIYNGTGTQIAAPIVAGAAIALDTWTHVVFYHDSVANQAGLIINNGAATVDPTTGPGGTSVAELTLGATQNGSSDFWEGRLNECGYWKRKLTAGEITTLYNGGAGVTYS